MQISIIYISLPNIAKYWTLTESIYSLYLYYQLKGNEQGGLYFVWIRTISIVICFTSFVRLRPLWWDEGGGVVEWGEVNAQDYVDVMCDESKVYMPCA